MGQYSDSKHKQAHFRSGAARKRGTTLMARTVLDRPPALQGWRTTDEEEVALRRWRGRTEIVAIQALEPVFRHVPCAVGERLLLRGGNS
jgi:hypothetical protein